MNPQFERLVNKTDEWCNANFPPDWLNRVDEYLPQWNEKFAELIIKECVKVCDKIYFDTYPDAEDFERSLEGDAIKEHFGVE